MEYFEPKTISDALSLLAKHGAEAKIIAGGTDVMVDIKYKEEPGCLVNIKKIPGLDGIRENGGSLRRRARQTAGAMGVVASVRLAADPQYSHDRRQHLPRFALGRNFDAAACA